MSNKTMWTILILAGIAVGVWFIWRWWKSYQAQGGGNLGLGTNLNSIAPELVGGSSGPQVQPAVSLPVNITLSETVASAQPPAESFKPVDVPPNNQINGANPTGNGMGYGTMVEDTSQETPLIKQTPTLRAEPKNRPRKHRREER